MFSLLTFRERTEGIGRRRKHEERKTKRKNDEKKRAKRKTEGTELYRPPESKQRTIKTRTGGEENS